MQTVGRKRDLSHISNEQEEALRKKLADKLSEILVKHAKAAKDEANQLLTQYGIEVETKIGYTLKEQKELKSKKRSKS